MSEKIYRVQMNSKGMPNFSTAEEIIRCGECKYYLPMQKNLPYAVRKRYCNKGAIKATSPDDFCSYGEREGE